MVEEEEDSFIKKNAPGISRRALKSSLRKELGLLGRRFVALRFQLSVLIFGKDCLGFLHEGGATLFGATRFHALILPRHQFRILISGQIKTRQIHAAGVLIRRLRALGAATRFPTGKGRARRQYPRCQ